MDLLQTVGVTGADGFIGLHVVQRLEQLNLVPIRLVRRREGCGRRVIGNLETSANLVDALRGVDILIHLAARAHVLRETESDPDAAFWRVNVLGTESLAQAAVEAGVRRFVFVSSIGVNGNRTEGGAFSEQDRPHPVETYARSKLAAEELLVSRFARSLELVIVRPPLVYGPGAEGNFARLVRLAASGLPLPLGSIQNRRNLLGVNNLSDFLCLCATHPKASGELFLVAEPEAYSTPDLLRSLAATLNRPSRIFRAPLSILRVLAAAAGKTSEFDKLCGSLEVSSSKANKLLSWRPRVTFQEQLEAVAAAYKREHEQP